MNHSACATGLPPSRLPPLSRLLAGQRILILGAGGWFGTTLLDELKVFPRASVLALASRRRTHQVNQRVWHLQTWDEYLVRAFQPTVVANFAFLTRERFDAANPVSYIASNRALIAQFMTAASLPSVSIALTCSSGAATIVSADLNPYGRLKHEEEQAALALARSGRTVVVGRAWSVSGPHVRRPHAYAFSDLILQAATGEMFITAEQPTYRRYVDVGDFLHVCLGLATQMWSGVIDSGGELVEMRELAELIRQQINCRARISRATVTTHAARVYASSNENWNEACVRFGAQPASLEQQVHMTAQGLLPANSILTPVESAGTRDGSSRGWPGGGSDQRTQPSRLEDAIP